MRESYIKIESIPTVVWGDKTDKVYLFIHGKFGCKEDAKAFAEIVSLKGWQVVSIDLPEHGERKEEKDSFDPWHVVPELTSVMGYIKQQWSKIALCANSIGAWFSMLSFADEKLEKCLFVSPILDMKRLIQNMMQWECVSEERLEQEKEIETGFGETLSWKYLMYVKEHPINIWNTPTAILYAGKDNLTEKDTVNAFVEKFHCKLEVMEDGEHWFHTCEQLAVLHQWINKSS